MQGQFADLGAGRGSLVAGKGVGNPARTSRLADGEPPLLGPGGRVKPDDPLSRGSHHLVGEIADPDRGRAQVNTPARLATGRVKRCQNRSVDRENAARLDAGGVPAAASTRAFRPPCDCKCQRLASGNGTVARGWSSATWVSGPCASLADTCSPRGTSVLSSGSLIRG